MTQTPEQQVFSLVNLAINQLGKGRRDKYDAYLDRARSVLPGGAMPKGGMVSLETLLLDSVFANAFYAFNTGDRETVADAARAANSPLAASMASSMALMAGDAKGALEFLPMLQPEEAVLKAKTAAMLPALTEVPDTKPRVHLIVLCHNREDFVAQAVRELAKTDYDNYAVYFADNGSEDGTWDELHSALPAFPDHVDVHVERLPTNIGRPAGHNWLLTKFDHSGADYIAIGDDDLTLVQPDWLNKMIATARAFPRVAAVGPKAINPGRPKIIHGGVRRFEFFHEDRFSISNEANEVDCGRHDCVQPVDHVIGCLHIYDRRALDEIGLFDIRFSPCQLVDIDHHLRTRLSGWQIIYNGLVEVEHYRAMGKKAAKDRALAGNSLGNVIKLMHKHDHREIQSFIDAERAKWQQWLESDN